MVMTLLVATTVTSAQSPGLANPPNTARDPEPLNMLVLGDSIMWGQGLREQDKFWWRIKNWLQQKTGRRVREKIHAHSGAVLEMDNPAGESFRSSDGEVNLLTPTINSQVDAAIQSYGNPAEVDLILVNGCINDVDVTTLLDTSTSLNSLEANITEKCGRRMKSLLTRIANGFPRAHVVLTGYYRIVSLDTENNTFTRMLIKKLTSLRPKGRKMNDREMRERLVKISDTWYQLSTLSLSQAAAAVNTELQQAGSRQRVLFAEIEFSPEHAFSAPQTLLWNFKFASTNLSGLRKLLIILTLGTAAYKPDDDVRKLRSTSCKETYKRPNDRTETKDEKKLRELRDLSCRYASLGHPNKMGALIYTESIKGQLQWLISEVGWLKTTSGLKTTTTLQPIPAN